MKEIEINGEKYILKADVDRELKDKKQKFSIIKPYGLTDLAHVMAMGTAQLSSTTKAVSIDADYLYTATKMIKQLGCSSVVIAIVSNEMPLVIGHEIDDNNRLSGLVIAPRIEKD